MRHGSMPRVLVIRRRQAAAPELDRSEVCHLTTTGRVTGRAHRIEIWFAHRQGTLYFLSGGGGRADWVLNLLRNPRVTVQVDGREHRGEGRVVRDSSEEALARDLLYRKYAERYADDLVDWRETALPVAVDLLP